MVVLAHCNAPRSLAGILDAPQQSGEWFRKIRTMSKKPFFFRLARLILYSSRVQSKQEGTAKAK